MIFQSIRWRLQLWYGLVFLALLAGFGFTAYALLRNVQMRHLDAEFQRRMGPMSGMMRPPPGGRGPFFPFYQDQTTNPAFAPGGPRGDGSRMGRGGPRGDRGGDFPNGGPQGDRGFARPDGTSFQFRIPADQAGLFGSESNSFYYVVWGSDGKELARSEAAPRDVPMTLESARARPSRECGEFSGSFAMPRPAEERWWWDVRSPRNWPGCGCWAGN
jgi:hypothetical protein